jgi:hypothetical protein
LVTTGLAIDRTGTPPATYWGMPDWVFVGILVPWVLCGLFSAFFSLFAMTDDDLGAEQEGEPAGGH